MEDYIIMEYLKNIMIFIGIVIILLILSRELRIETTARFNLRVKERMEQIEDKKKKRLNK